MRALRARVLAGSILLGSASFVFPTMALARVDVSIGFSTFHDQLAAHGDWVYSDRWGEVWVPVDVPDDFHPYASDGHWVYTDEYGWYWVSDYDWGDIPFHYGRWVNDPDAGWIWIPGYVWSPAWVVWRSGGNYVGWMPMPPDDDFLRGASFGISSGGISFAINFGNLRGYYGYSRWYGRGYGERSFDSNWTFVRSGHFADRDFGRYTAPSSNYRMILRMTRDRTNYSVSNNYIVNRGIDVHTVERASGHPVQQMRASDVITKPQFVAPVDTGRDVHMRMRGEAPRGTGIAGSAPRPPQQVIDTLSITVHPHRGHEPAHIFTQHTVTSAPLSGTPPSGTGAGPRGTGAGQGRPTPPTTPSTSPSTGPVEKPHMQSPPPPVITPPAPQGTPPSPPVHTESAPTEVTPGTPETPHGRHEHGKVLKGTEPTPPETGNITPDHPATPDHGTVAPGEHPRSLQTIPETVQKPPAPVEKNPPTLPTPESTPNSAGGPANSNSQSGSPPDHTKKHTKTDKHGPKSDEPGTPPN